ncbi:hypothetical protein D3C85_1946940 [compost metagenome]
MRINLRLQHRQLRFALKLLLSLILKERQLDAINHTVKYIPKTTDFIPAANVRSFT